MKLTHKYTVNIKPLTEGISIGTGFFGEGFSTRDEFIALMKEYGTGTGDNGKKHWHSAIKITFCSGETTRNMIEIGNRQGREQGFVNLFSVCSSLGKDPINKWEVYFFPYGVKHDPECKVAIRQRKSKDLIFKRGRLTEVVRELGVEF